MAINLAIASAKKGLNNNKTYHKTNCSFTASLFSPGEIDFRWLRRQPFHRLSECYHSARCFLTDRSIVRFSSPLDHQGTDGRPNKNQTAFQSTAYLPASLALFCCIAFAFAFSSCSFALLRPAQEKKTLIKIPLSISVSTFRAALAARSRSLPVQEVCDRSTSLCHKREKKAFIRMMKMMMALPRALDACALRRLLASRYCFSCCWSVRSLDFFVLCPHTTLRSGQPRRARRNIETQQQIN